MRAKTILTILFLLSLGVAGLIFLKAMSLQTAAKDGPEVLAAAVAMEPRTLLRAQDVTWQPLTGPMPPGAILRPTEAQRRDKPLLDDETRAAVYGAVLRGAAERGAPITNDLIVKPGERDFLRVVLTPGQRAIAIPVKTGGASAGLLEPGDQVDVILTQKFNEKDERMARRSVAETVAEDLRVLAIDEPKGKTNVAVQGDFGRTVTLQVTPEQAQKVNVATELGKLSLTLRPSSAAPDVVVKKEPNSQAVWAGDVSPALGSVKPPENAVVADPGIQVMRGEKAVQVKIR
jgi:pilus assembly protein CpaB